MRDKSTERMNSAFTPEVRGQAMAFSSLLARSVREFFKDESNRKQFESWYEQKYGIPYQWEPMIWRNK